MSQAKVPSLISALILALLGILAGFTAFADNGRPDLLTTTVGDSLGSGAGWLAGLSAWHVNSPGKPYSVEIAPSISFYDEQVVRFELRAGETWTGRKGSRTFRAELVPSIFPAKQSVRFYSCSIMIPKDFPVEKNRLVLMQWWPLTKTELGEKGRSPSLALRYVNGLLSVTVDHSDLHVVTNPDAVPEEKIFETSKLLLGEWNSFVFEAKWSFKSDGFAKVWWNGKLEADYKGPVGYDDEQGPLFKFGLYRNDSPKSYVVYFSQCREGSSMQDVAPRS